MSDYLVIVESPAKAKTIERYLGKKYTVKASMGHVRDLPKSKMGIDFEDNYRPNYITIRGKGPVLKELRTAAKKAKKIYLAADPDREGEAIAWHLAHNLNVDPSSECRVVFNEITKEAVKDSFKSPRPINMDLVDAQQGRRILDRLVGYNISPLLWKKVKKGLSAGRVQSVAVKMIIDREHEIKKFKPEEYWSITGNFLSNDESFEGYFYRLKGAKQELANKEAVDQILKLIPDKKFTVTKVTKRERKRNAAVPFTTSSLQQEAARKLNFRARKTMMIAQQLYEGIDLGRKEGGITGLITYMRTDSTRISETARAEGRDFITEKYGPEYLGENQKVKNQQKAQDAHEAVRPTSAFREPSNVKDKLSRDQYRLYKLIWDRFIASLMSPAIMDTMTVQLEQNGVQFRATGSKIKFKGFMKIYIEGNDDNVKEEHKLLPALEEGMVIDADKIIPNQHFTQPPPRYTEARLVKTMEENGIGRPSTFAPTLDTIQRRGYVTLDNKRFVPTELGEIVINLIIEFFPKVIDVAFTAQMETDLDQIEAGEVEWVTIIDNFYQDFEKKLKIAEKEMENVEIKDEPAGEDCEKCGNAMVYKLGRYGKFMACSNFPECRNTKAILKEIGVTCPKCEKGQVVERKSKQRRTFYGCDQYPDCDFLSWDKPVARLCPNCNEQLVEKKSKQGVTVQCIACDYKESTVK